MSQDNPVTEGISRDLISFVTLIHTDPDPFLTELNAANRTIVPDQEINQDQFATDVQRIAYYIGPRISPDNLTLRKRMGEQWVVDY